MFNEKPSEPDQSETVSDKVNETVEERTEAGGGDKGAETTQPSWQEERERILQEAEERALRRLRAEQAAARPTDTTPAPVPQNADPELQAILTENAALEAQVQKDGGFTNDTLVRSQRLQQRILALGLSRADREIAELKAERAAEAVGDEAEWKKFAREHKGEGTPKMLRLAWERERDVEALSRADKAKKDADAQKAFRERRIADTTTRDVTAREAATRKMTQTEFNQRQAMLKSQGRDAEALQEQRDYRRGRIEVTQT